MSHANLYDLTPRAFWNAVDGYWKTKEDEDRKVWEKVRWQTCCLINVHMPRNKQVSQECLMPFYWEGKGESEISTYEQTLFAYEKFEKQKKLNK